jgi:hypothetical protein
MKPDDATERIEPAQDRDKNIPVEREVGTEAAGPRAPLRMANTNREED